MTLIVSPGEDVLSSSSDDADSGCLAGSPDIKDDSLHVAHHDLFLSSKLKRLSLQDVKALQVPAGKGQGQGEEDEEEEEEEEEMNSVISTPTCVHSLGLQSDKVSNKNNTNSDDVAINDDDVDCDSKRGSVKEDVGHVNNSSSSPPRPFVIYDCKVSVDSIPSACSNEGEGSQIPGRRLEGPAVVSTPVIQLASQINSHESDSLNKSIPSGKQTSMLTMQLMACNNNNNNNNNHHHHHKSSSSSSSNNISKDSSSSSSNLVSNDVIETRTPAHPPSSEKRSENEEGIGGYGGGGGGGVVGSVVSDDSSDVTPGKGATENSVIDGEEDEHALPDPNLEREDAVDIASEDQCGVSSKSRSSLNENDSIVEEPKTDSRVQSDATAGNAQECSKYSLPEEISGKVNDIHRAKEKINLLRQNFLSSLSAEEDCDPPDFIVLPHHSDNPQGDPWEEEGNEEEKNTEGEREKGKEVDSKDSEGKGKCSGDGIKVMGGSECGSIVSNGSDSVQEAEEVVKEEKKEEEKEEEGEGEVLAMPGAGGFSDGCQVMQSVLKCAFYDNEHLEREKDYSTAQDNAISLDDVLYTNVIPAKSREVEEDERVSSVKLLVSEASARLMEHEISGRVEASNSHVSSDITMCGRGNPILKSDITPETTVGGDMPDSSFVVSLQKEPPSEPPPSLPPSPPPPPSSPQSPNLFSRDASSSPPNYLKNQSTSFVNLMMLQSRKHKRLHRLRLPESASSNVTDLPSVVGEGDGGGVREAKWRVRSDDDCEERLQLPLLPPPSSAQPPQQHGNQHVQLPSSTNAHCGTTDQLCRLGLPPPPPLHSSRERFAGGSRTQHHQPRQTLLSSGVEGDQSNTKVEGQSDSQRKGTKATSLFRKLEEERKLKVAYPCDAENESKSAGASENDSVFENDSCCSDNSCLGYLNFDHESFVDSDNDYDIEQKNKLKEACKDIARALNTLPSPVPEEQVINPQIVCSQFMYHDTRPQYRDQQVEAHLSDTDDPLAIDRLSVQVRSCGTSTTSDDDRRNSFYDNCGMDGGHCECGRCDISDVEELRGRFPPPPPPPPPSSPPPPLPPARIMDKRKKASRERNAYRCGIRRDTSDLETEEEGFRTDAGEGCRTDEFDLCTTSDDNDYDDYCQTDDCGEECDYCSGDDAEDEAEDTCYFCKQSQNVTPVCKHPGVITNGILKSFNGRGREEKECGARGVPHGRSLALQAAIHRRRLTRQGLVAIRESSITSDELPESEEEQSYDGSNCDISSSWRFGLCRDMTMSRDSTLRSVQSDRSSSSLPAEQVRQRHKEKSNSLPGANSRSMAGGLPGRHAASGGSGSTLRQVSTSDDESGSHSSLPRLPPRPPRAPRMRPPLTPSPPAGGSLITPSSPSNPRPAMGLQGLQQQRSPGTPRALHVSGLPVAPRTVAPRSPSNPNPPYGFPVVGGATLLCPGSPGLAGRSTPSPGGGSEGPPASPRISSRAGALVTRNFSISDDEGGGRWSGGRRHVTITRHESVYKEVAEKGYHLPPGSPVDPYWLTWKLGVLQKTVEEVSGRLEEAQKTADGWGPLSQDPNLADQHAHNVRKFREGLAELQRGVDDVNDQAARFSAHNVPLTPANSAKLHDLNNRWKSLETAVNDRWRQVASRSREVTPLTPAQLASSVSPPWERATTSNKVPYYINHDQESTHWDHPVMMDLLDSMNEFNHIKFSAYRTATKLRILQKKLALDLAKLQMATDIFDEHGLRGQNDRLIDVGDMVVVLSALYANISADHPEVDTTLAMDLCLNWLLNVYDSQRTGQMRVLSFKIGLVCLCCGHLEEKYRYMFRLIADPNRLVDQRKLGLLLHDCVQVPRQLGEVAAFGGSNIEPSVRSCFTKAGKDRETIEAVHFLTWVQQEPQSLVWLAVLHRVAASENIQHQVKCNICKAYPIIGLRYRCLKCLSFDMCQRCFFDGRSGKSHKITHPMHEYCTATTAGEDVKDFTKALKNKFKSKRSLQKHTKKGYLPVQTVLEGDPLESPSPSPQHNVTSQDMHSRLELYASRLAEVELRTNSNSTPDSEDEHGLIAQYCQSLSSSDAPLPVPRSPLQIMAAVDAEQKDELEQMIRALEEENSVLQAEYDRLKSQQPVGSPPDDGLAGQRSEADMLAEAKLLRQHKGRLEARMGILEEHNRQLEAQLHRLRQLLGEPGGVSSPNKSGTLQTKSVTASQLAMDSPAKVNGHSTQGGATSAYEGLEQMSEYVRPPPPPMGSVAHVGNLFSRAGDLGKAVGTLVATMTHEGASDLPSDEEGNSNASDTEEEKAV